MEIQEIKEKILNNIQKERNPDNQKVNILSFKGQTGDTLSLKKIKLNEEKIGEVYFVYEINDSPKSTWPMPPLKDNTCNYMMMDYDNEYMFLEVHYAPIGLSLNAIKAKNMNILLNQLQNKYEQISIIFDDEYMFDRPNSITHLEKLKFDLTFISNEIKEKRKTNKL